MSGLVNKITKAVMGISAIVVFVITFLQVLCRFVLKSPLPWSTDILRLAVTYLVFWGAAWCVREKEHLNVDVLLMSFPVKIRKVVELGIVTSIVSLFHFYDCIWN
ncbi:MAG: TRAP transporter small permease [Clostridium fessum]